jgi:hypothetical protein
VLVLSTTRSSAYHRRPYRNTLFVKTGWDIIKCPPDAMYSEQLTMSKYNPCYELFLKISILIFTFKNFKFFN